MNNMRGIKINPYSTAPDRSLCKTYLSQLNIVYFYNVVTYSITRTFIGVTVVLEELPQPPVIC